MNREADIEHDAQLAALLTRCAEREARALEALYRHAAPRLLGCLVKILRRRALAEEALQDVFVQIWDRAAQFDEHRGRPWAWMLSMARYRAIDILRRERSEAVDPAILASTLDATVTAFPGAGTQAAGEQESAYALDASGNALERCLAQLGDEQRDSIRLAFLGGRSHPEVAEQLGRPLGSVKSWIRRGLVALRECIDACNVRATN